MSSKNHRHRFSCVASLGLSDSRTKTRTPRLITEGILDANVDASTPGSVRVALWHEWQGMLSDLRAVGPVWSMVRNSHSILAVEEEYPALTFSTDQQAAHARHASASLTCHFRAWHRAAAFESGCCCGRIYGFEIHNDLGKTVHRVCLAEGASLEGFIEWTQMHQATGLEEDCTPALAVDEGRFHPQAFRRHPGALEVPVDRLRTALIHAAQREIPLVAGVTSEGATQTARLEIQKASEAHGWLVLSGPGRSFYVNAEPTGTLLAEPASHDGETHWQLSLIDGNDHRLLHVCGTADDCPAWNQLVREFVLCSSMP
jgi:putative heme degradation protein